MRKPFEDVVEARGSIVSLEDHHQTRPRHQTLQEDEVCRYRKEHGRELSDYIEQVRLCYPNLVALRATFSDSMLHAARPTHSPSVV